MKTRNVADILKSIQESLKKVKLPWTATENYPFYIDVRKPRESLSKHDSERLTYWDIYDGEYMLKCVNEMPKILKYIKSLERKLKEYESISAKYQSSIIVEYSDCTVHNCSSQTCMIAGRKCGSWM